MSTFEERSDQFAAYVMARVVTGAFPLLATNDVGERFAVTALGYEPVRDLFARVRDAGGYATTFLLVDGEVTVVPFLRAEGAILPVPGEEIEMPFDSQSTVAMFVEYVKKHPEGVSLSVSGRHRLPALAKVDELVAV